MVELITCILHRLYLLVEVFHHLCNAAQLWLRFRLLHSSNHEVQYSIFAHTPP